jgi:hypothetical protein
VALVVGRGAPVAGVGVHHQGGAGGPQRQGEVLWCPMRVGRVDHAVAVSAVEGHDTCSGTKHRRIASRSGPVTAIDALEHAMLIAVCNMLTPRGS